MNKTVELVNEWATFQNSHPEASIEDFCRYYVMAQHSNQAIGPNFKGTGVPPSPGSYLMKLLGYIVRIFQTYITNAFSEVPEIRQPEDFYFLNHISHLGECRKTDVINAQLLGLSTGIDVLNRLLTNELIEERGDPADKRARLIKLTEKGREVLHHCYRQAGKVSDIVLSDLSEQDILLATQLLRGIEIKHAPLIFELRDKPLNEIYEKVVGRPPVETDWSKGHSSQP